MSILFDVPFTWRDAIDIALVTYIFYRLILLVRGTRAVPVIYGLLLIGVVFFISGELGLHTLHWMFGYFLGSIFLIIIILFQDNIRKALSDVGTKSRIWRKKRQFSPEDDFISILCDTAMDLAHKRIGAIMVLERSTPLGDLAEKGVPVNAKASPELITSIFYPGTPLHDGAIILRNDEILAARCVLPLSKENTPSGLGTRHRAALGVAAQSDALALVVSEERGTVSLAIGNTLETMPNMPQLKQTVSAALGRVR